MERVRDWLSPRRLAIIVAVLAGIVAVWLSLDLFPYRSINHDEGVYLNQAAMLLDGRLAIEPPVRGSLRPWFFVQNGDVLYPKYTPVAAAIFATGMALGEPALALGPIAAATVILTYATGAEAFDSRIGLVAAVLLVASPFFVIQSAVFLSYLPTLALLLLFAWAYLRADRTDDEWVAAFAGAAVGIAFFSRPFTTVLFAAPFIAHTCWKIWVAPDPTFRRSLITAIPGLLGVGVALGYNRLMTGAALRFPYEAFGPHDGPGFGRRELLGYVVDYDLELAFESARIALSTFATRWTVAPPIGIILGAIGLVRVLERGRNADPRQLILAGLVISIPVGQLTFWGTHNAIGNLDDPGLGLMGHLGPFYHLPLLIPTVVFAAVAIVAGWDHFRPDTTALEGRQVYAIALAGIIVVGGFAGVAGLAIADVIGQNRVVTQSHAAAYEPIEQTSFEDDLVFLPTPQGNWLAHPFQYLRNEPTFDGPVVYAQDRRIFAVLKAFPDRQPFRYAYHGDWFPADREHVVPTLRPLETVRGDRIVLEATAGLPPSATGITAILSNRNGTQTAETVLPENDTVQLQTVIVDSRASLTINGDAGSNTIPLAANDTAMVTLFVDTGGLDSFEYVLELPVLVDNGTLWSITPRQRVCTD
ncbi:MAG: glycosyltransferase family 39 protein, partial [Salinirussus sp.]